MSWFEDCTYLGDNVQFMDRIKKDCHDQGYIPLFGYHPEQGWTFHTIFPPDGTVSKKKIAAFFERKQASVLSCEKDLERCLVRFYKKKKKGCRYQVQCDAGIADIVTDDAVIEVEYTLSRSKAFEAIGQVLAYRQAINPFAKAEIVALSIDNQAMPIVYAAMQLGIIFRVWSVDLEGPCLI